MFNRPFPLPCGQWGTVLISYSTMIAIIAEKPSVGQDIARVVGAARKKEGYREGNGYAVTWALGHLISLAMPEAYGHTGDGKQELPVVPDDFRLAVRQVRTDRGMITDLAAAKQLRIIEKVFGRCESIIVATDAGREGELIFRLIYDYLKPGKPFRRLWISSLTDEAIRGGLARLRDGHEYDSLYDAAFCRAKADWLVGMNASRALGAVSGTPNNSIGRVQTPTLAMICSRYRENREFVSTPYWMLHVTLKKDGDHRIFRHTEKFEDRQAAERAYSRICGGTVATITRIERQPAEQAPPLPYDLTALQKDCNALHGFTAEKTLEIAQTLYERKMISYPRTGCRHIPRDVMAEIPTLLGKIIRKKEFREYGKSFNLTELNMRCVDDTKMTDHHALITTGVTPVDLTGEELTVYMMIAGRMLEAFSPPCRRESLLMEAECAGLVFRSCTSVVLSPGWRGVFSKAEDRTDGETEPNDGTAVFRSGERIPVSGSGIVRGKTLPKPLHTEATLLAAMEACGKDIADGEAREAIRELGIGTPATRASIIETLIRRGYVSRSEKNIIPTEKGMFLYNAVRDMRVADAELTGTWEKKLLQIERRTLTGERFMREIGDYTRQITRDVLGIRFPAIREKTFPCPRCRKGNVAIRGKAAKCDSGECGFVLFRKFLNKELTDFQMTELLTKGETGVIKGLRGKNGKTFDASLSLGIGQEITLAFPKRTKGKRGSGMPVA